MKVLHRERFVEALRHQGVSIVLASSLSILGFLLSAGCLFLLIRTLKTTTNWQHLNTETHEALNKWQQKYDLLTIEKTTIQSDLKNLTGCQTDQEANERECNKTLASDNSRIQEKRKSIADDQAQIPSQAQQVENGITRNIADGKQEGFIITMDEQGWPYFSPPSCYKHPWLSPDYWWDLSKCKARNAFISESKEVAKRFGFSPLQFKQIENEIDALQEQLAAIQPDVNRVECDLTTIHTTLSDLRGATFRDMQGILEITNQLNSFPSKPPNTDPLTPPNRIHSLLKNCLELFHVCGLPP